MRRNSAFGFGTPCSVWTEKPWVWDQGFAEQSEPEFHVVAIDYGVKRNILRLIAGLGAKVTILPAKASAEAPKSGLGAGAVLAFVFLGLVVVVALVASTTSRSDTDVDAALKAIPGAPHAVDPLALLPMAQNSAPGRFLVSIEARYVDENGRVDLRALSYMGSITYTFGERPPEPTPDPSRPLGAPQPSRGMPSESKIV